MPLLFWDIYEIRSSVSLQGVMLRGRLRKFANRREENLLVENDEGENVVRFAVLARSDVEIFRDFLVSMVSDVSLNRVRERISNPVLSKLKVNEDERYTIDE